MRRVRTGLAALLLTASMGAAPAPGGLCGDDVDGHDIPCACGDVVVADVALGDDPVVSGPPCPHDGLIVRAPDARHGLVIDLKGATLRGTGAGVGIRVIDGGPVGARLVSSGGTAQILGFQDGIVARGTDTIGLIEDIVVGDSHRDGVRVSGPEFTIRRVLVRGARRDGFALGGRGFRITDTNASDCGRFGYSVMGDSGQIGAPGFGNVAERSGMAGFNIMGAGHALADCLAAFGLKSGVHLQGVLVDVRGCRANDNGGDGIEGMGSNMHLSGNEALRNAGDGIDVRGVSVFDEGGNRGVDNRGDERESGVVQCAIAGAPCLL